MTIAGLARDIADKSADDTRSSLAYCASGLREMLVGGLITLSCFLLVGIPLLLGYMHRCLTEVMGGDERLPGFGRPRDLIGNGLRLTAIGVIYAIVVGIPFLALFLIEILTLPGLTITKISNPGDTLGYMVRYDGFTATVVIITLTSVALSFAFSTLFSNAWLRHALGDSLRSAANPVKTLRWTLANPVLLLSKMFSFGLLGVIFGIPGLLALLVPGADRDLWPLFAMYSIAYPWLVFTGLIANTFLRGRQIRGLLSEGKLKPAD